MLSCSQHPDTAATAACTRCDKPLCDACTEHLEGRPYCSSCVEELRAKLEDRARATGAGVPADVPPAPIGPRTPANWNRAALWALGAGLVGAAVWFGSVVLTDYKLGLVAIGVGWLVGAASAKGAGAPGGPGLGLLSLAIAVGAMFLGEYLIINHFVLEAFAEQNPGETLAFTPLGVFFEVYGESFGPLDAVFYAIGAYEAYKIPTAAGKR